ncbi:transposase [Agromyces seonyuensis]|uniref:transposase n=1 Tax=Agromyces seonyuensis TaxID=2662446 RepID=UPI003AFA9199
MRGPGVDAQGYYKWLKDPVSRRDWDDAHLLDVIRDVHSDDATLGYRFITDELRDEHGITVGENRVHRPCRIARITPATTSPGRRRPARRGRRRMTTSSRSSTSTACSVTSSSPTGRTGCGCGTSRNTPPGKASSTSARSRTSGRTRSSATPSTPG